MKDEVINELQERGDQAQEALRTALTRIRTGRANLSILDNTRVEYYGAKSPLNQVATLTVADARMITIKPFDKALLSPIEKVLRASADLGLSPQNDGEKIMLPIPPLTEERRKEFTKVARAKSEDAKISVRNARRDANETFKLMEKDGDLPEDDSKKAQAEVQKITDGFVQAIEATVSAKEKEIMEV